MLKDCSNIAVAWYSRARLGARAWLALGCLLALASTAGAGSLSNVSPTGASIGIQVTVHGTGFDATAANNRILLTPPSGAPVTVIPTATAVVDAARGIRSLTFRVPTGVAAGATPLKVTNTVTGEVSEGRTLQIVGVSLPEVQSGPRGATGLVVRLAGTPNAEFSTINTRVTFGAGVTVTATNVESPTAMTVTIDIAANASLSTRTLAITTPTQLFTLAKAFNVTEGGGTPNRAPIARPGGPYTASTGQPLTIDGSTSSDPDAGDTLTYAWDFGDSTPAGSGASVQHTYQAAGTYTLSLTVTDNRGAASTATTTVTVGNAPTNRPPTAVIGGPYTGRAGQAIAFDASGSSDPDGDAITFAWNFGDSSPAAAGAQVQHIYQSAGTFTATLTVTDARNASRSATTQVTVTNGPPDETAPFVTMNAPTSALAGSQVTVTALATDNVGVTRVTFLVNGANETVDETAPFERVLTIPADATPGTTFVVRGTASDLAGNTGYGEATITVAATPDTTDPTVALNAPPHAAPSQAVQLTATATDNVGVASVAFLAAGAPIATITQPPYQTTFTIPANATVGSTITIVARATDLSGRTKEDTADITIVAAPDTTPPTIELSAPTQIGAGRSLLISALAADNAGVASVQFFVDDVLIATDTQAPYDASFPVPADAANGTVLKLRARVVDYASLEAVDTADVNVLANQSPVANAGGPYTVQVGDLLPLNGAASSDPDGDALSYAWNFGDSGNGSGATGSGPAPSHAYTAAGTFTVTLTVSDGRGGSAQATATVTVTGVTDRAAPAITLAGPSRVLPGTQVTVTAQVSDNVGVTGVEFTIDGANPGSASGAPFTRVVDIPAVAAPGTTIVVRGVANDAAGNKGAASLTMTITPSPDTTAPTVAMRLPARTSAGATIVVGANAMDETGVKAVTFYAGAVLIGTDDTAPYEATWTVPAGSAAGTNLPFSARAVDFGDNAANASGTVPVAEEGDTTPPTVTLSAPATVAAGGTLHLSANAQDQGGVTSVEFFLDGVKIGVDAVAPFQTDYVLPAGRLPGTLLRLQARAVDFAGLDTTAAAESRVSAAGQGVIAGEVFDTSTGLPLAGVSVSLIGKDTRGQDYSATATSDARGRYLLRAEEGEGTLRLTKSNWTTVLRKAVVITGRAMQPVDARLTPQAPAITVQPVVGGLIAQDGHELTVPGGAIAAVAALHVTPVGPQALEALLPGGWSPIAGVDIAPRGITFGQNVSVKVPQVRQLSIGTEVLLARYDEPTAKWKAVAIVPIAGDGRSLAGELTQTGQYVWLLPDTTPQAPALPAPGLDVPGLDIAPLPDGTATIITPQPKVLFYQPGVRSIVSGVVTNPQALSSGVVLRTRISESYTFFSGAESRPEPFSADIVFYQAAADGKTLGATYPVTPSLPFEALSLKEGVIGVELYAPNAQDAELPLIGSDGGSATASTGERLDVPPAAISEQTPFRVERLPASQLGMTLPAGVTFAGGVSLDFSGDLNAAASVSIARPADLPAGSRVLFARIEDIGGESRFLLAGVGRIDGDRLVSDIVVPGASAPLAGVRKAGRYLFLRIGNTVGFFSGLVTGVNNAPFAGALITSNRLPAIVSRSAADGRYLAAVLTGASTLTAKDLARNDVASADGSVGAAWSVATLNLTLVAQRPSVTSVSPGANAVSVPLSAPIVVKFSEPIDPASVNGRIVLSGSGGPVASTLVFSGGDTIVTLRPTTPLGPNARYTVAINQAITDVSGYTLVAAVTSTFDTLDTDAPPPPPAGAITARIPTNGQTMISASQGTASPHDRVFIVNKRTGQQTPVVVNPDGSFTVTVPATLKDTFEIRIIDQSGNVTIVALDRFRDPDGRVVVGPEGGTVDAANGLRLTVSPGTFPDGATVKFTPLAPAAVNPTVPVGDDYPLVAGFEIDASVAPKRYMNVSFPAPAGTTAQSTGIVTRVVDVYGQKALSIVDTAKIIDGRIATSSPPCEGIVNKFGRYAMYMNEHEKMKLGIALLSLTVPRSKPVVLQPYTITNPFLPYPPTILHPGMQFEQLYHPATPFISLIEAGRDVEDVLDQADNSTPVCFPVPGDTTMRVVVRDAQTGALIQSVAQTTPPAGQIATIDSIYVAPGDTSAPSILWSSWSPKAPYILDAGKAIQMLFNEPVAIGAAPGVDAAYIVNQLTGQKIKVTGHLSNGQRGVTFVPQGSLPIGTDFILYTPGLRDLSGNPFDQPQTFRTFEPTLVIPGLTPAGPIHYNKARVLNDFTFAGITVPSTLQSVALNDIDFVTRKPEETVDGKWKTTLFGIGNSRDYGFQILSIDASQPRQPQAIGMMMGGQRFYNQMKVVRDFRLKFRTLPSGDPREQPIAAWRARQLHYLVDNPDERICAADGDPAIAAWRARQEPGANFAMKSGGCGTLGLATSFNTYYAILHLYDLTDATKPRLLGQRLLADGGGIAGYPRKNEAPAVQGPAARGVDILSGVDFTHVIADQQRVHEDAVAGFVAVFGSGVTAVDLGENVPDVELTDRLPDGTLIESLQHWTFPYYQDLQMLGTNVVAIARDQWDGTNTAHLEVFTPGLTPIGAPVQLPTQPYSMTTVKALVTVDMDGDGTPEPQDFALVTGKQGLATVAVKSDGTAELAGFVPMPNGARAFQGLEVSQLTGTCPNVTFKVGDFTVRADQTTHYRRGGCENLVTGAKVAVVTKPVSDNSLRVTELTFLETPAVLIVEALRHVEVDKDNKTAYIAGSWKKFDQIYEGFVVVDLSNPYGGMRDEDQDGWDDRIRGFIPVTGIGTQVHAGRVNGFRFDNQRKLIYAALDGEPDDMAEANLAILRTCECGELEANVRLESGGAGTGPDRPSADGTTTTIFVTPEMLASGTFRAKFDIDSYSGGAIHYSITEFPTSGRDEDKLLDLSSGATGVFSGGGLQQILLALRQLGANPRGSVIAIDFTDADGNFLKRAILHLIPTSISSNDVKVRTYIDRTNGQIYETPAYLTFLLNHEAKVTVRIDGQVIQQPSQNGLPGAPFENVPLPAGLNQVLITRPMITAPGEHPYQIFAEYEQGVSIVKAGKAIHEVVISESLPVGHTFIKGVDLSDGHLALAREDIALPTTGPALMFSRTYSSIGNNSGGTMGAGWAHNFQSSLTVDSQGRISIAGGEGSGVKFSQLEGNDPEFPGARLYKPHAGYHGKLAAKDGAFDYYTTARTRYHYELAPNQQGDPLYRLTFIEDANGNRLTLAYAAANDLLQTVTDASGRTLTFTHEQKGDALRLTKIEGPMNLVVTYDYDEHGNLIKAARDEREESYAYSIGEAKDRHNLTRITDPNGKFTDYTYFAANDTFPGEQTPFEWGRDILKVPMKSELVKRVTEGAETPEAAVTAFTFDYSNFATRYVTTVKDANGTDTRYTLHPRGAVTEVRVLGQPGGDNVTKMRWAFEDNENDVQLKRKEDANGRVTRLEYDTNGNMIRETIEASVNGYAPVAKADGSTVTEVVTTWEYDAKFNRLKKKTDAEGSVTEYEIDPANGNVLSMTTDPADGTPKVVTHYTYATAPTANGGTLKGLLKSVTDPRNNAMTYETFDERGNATRTVSAEGHVTTQVFDLRGRLTEVSDTLGHQVTTEYDALDRVKKQTKFAVDQPAEASLHSPDLVTETTYFPGGQKKLVTDGLGHETELTYDGLNRLASQTDRTVDADGSAVELTMSWTYDGNGNRKVETDRRGIARHFTFDGFNRQRKVEVVDGATRKTISEQEYDAAGNLVADVDLHGHRTRYEFDALYRRVKVNLPLAPYALTMTYDLTGHELSSTDANGVVTRQTYDGMYRRRSLTDGAGNQTLFDYDAASNLVKETHVQTGLVKTHGPFDRTNRQLGSAVTFTDPLTSQTVTHTTSTEFLDAEHAVLSTNPRGHKMKERFNGLDKAIEKTVDPDGLKLTTTFQYDANGNEVAVRDAEGSENDVVRTFDGLGRKLRSEYPLGGAEKTYYDGNGNVTKTINRRGIEMRLEYDAFDRRTAEILVESISNAGAELTLSSTVYDDVQNRVTTTNARGKSSVAELDALHHEVKTTNALNEETIIRWDGLNRRQVTAASGKRRQFDYDGLNRLTTVREYGPTGETPLSTMTTEYRDAESKQIDTDRRGVQRISQYNAVKQLRRVTRKHAGLSAPYGAEEVVMDQFQYDGNGNLVSAIDANGKETTYVYDPADRRGSMTEAAGTPLAATSTFTYDKAGNLLTAKDARAHGGAADLTNTYDARNRRLTQTDGEGNVKTYTYDQADEVETMTEPLGGIRVTRYAYDEAGALLSVDETRNGVGGVTRYLYDASRNKVAQQDAAGNLTTWVYDDLDRLADSYEHTVAGTIAEGTTRGASAGGDQSSALHWHYEYDLDGNERLLVDAEGQQVTKAYDHLNRLVRKDYAQHKPAADGSVIYPQISSIVMTLDGNGSPTRVEEAKKTDASNTVTQVTTMTYDPLNRLSGKTNPDTRTVGYTYDKSGNRLTVTDADNVTTSYTYDDRNRVATATTEGGRVTRYDYWPDNLPKSTTSPNGVVSETTYDKADRILRVLSHGGDPAQPIAQYDYTYDANGNRKTTTERHRQMDAGAAQQTTYDYDDLNRLKTVTYPGGGTMAYTFATNGNRLTEVGTDPASSTPVDREFAYTRTNQLTRILNRADAAASMTFSYDRNGNTREQRTGTLAGDVIAAPTAVKRFDFDVRDRLRAVVSGSDRTTFDYDYTGLRNRRTITGGGEVGFLYDEGALLQEYDAATRQTNLKYNYGAGLLSLVSVGSQRQSFFYSFDGQRSAAALTDDAGTVQAGYAYTAFGGLRRIAENTPNRVRYTGKYDDTETGLQYFGARYYDPAIGRFISQDPYGGDENRPPSLHKYTYAHNNPATFGDPTGYAAESFSETMSDLGEWSKGVATGVAQGVFGAVADLLEQGVKGLSDIGMTGVGMLAMEATGHKYNDEIGQLLTPESRMGQLAMEKGTIGAIKESATGFVKDTVKGAITLPQRVVQASLSGDPEQLGLTMTEVAQMAHTMKAPLSKLAQPVTKVLDRAIAAEEFLWRERISKRNTGAGGAAEKVYGTMTVQDAWQLAKACVGPGVSGCAVVGGLQKPSFGNLVRNVFSGDTIARGELVKNEAGKYFKFQGDIDFMQYRPDTPVYNDAALARQLNKGMSSPTLDTFQKHGVMGEYLPQGMVPPDIQRMWNRQRGLPDTALVRAFDYWKEGIEKPKWMSIVDEHGTELKPRGRQAFLNKPGKAGVTVRALETDAFEIRSRSHLVTEAPWFPTIPTVVNHMISTNVPSSEYEKRRAK